MVSLMRNKRSIYICTKYIDEKTNVTKFKKPKRSIRINWQPISSTGEVLSLGIEYSKFLRITGSKEDFKNIHNDDRVYVYVKPDLINFNEMCEDADYKVSKSPIVTLNEGEVLLEKLSGSEEEYGI